MGSIAGTTLGLGRWIVYIVQVVLLISLATEASPSPPFAATKSPTQTGQTNGPTAFPTPAPTLPAPAKTTSRRITTQQDCAKQGRQVNCAWNPQVVVYDGYSKICEPTEIFLNISAAPACRALTNDTCRFDANSKCILRNEQDCSGAPLSRLIDSVKDLIRRSTALSGSVAQLPVSVQEVIKRSQLCADVSNNITCRASPYCIWIPSPETPSVVVTEGILTSAPAASPIPLEPPPTSNITTASPQVPETQIIEVFSSSNAVRADIKQIRVTSPKKLHERLVTITTQVRWGKPENQTRIKTGWFKLTCNTTEVSDAIPYNASTNDVQRILRKLSLLKDATVRSNINYTDDWGRMSWIVNATNAKLLKVNDTLFVDMLDTIIPNDTSRVMITQHQRNTQVLMMFGRTAPAEGQFALAYTWVDFPDEWGGFQKRKTEGFPAFATMLPSIDRFNPNEPAQSFQDKLNNFKYSGIKVFDWVSVSKPDSVKMQDLASKATSLGLGGGNPLRDAWIIEFTTLISQYERAEFPLTVLSTPVLGSNGSSVPFYGVLGERETDFMDFSVQVDMPSPVVYGRMGKPMLYTANEPLPGMHALDPRNQTQLLATWRDSSLRIGDKIRIAGNFYTVMNLSSVPTNLTTTGLGSNSSVFYHSVIAVDRSVWLPQNVNDTSVRQKVGWQAFVCRPILDGVNLVNAGIVSLSTTDDAGEIQTMIGLAANQFYNRVEAVVTERDMFGGVTFTVNLFDADGEVPLLDFASTENADVVLPLSSNWFPQSGARLDVLNVQSGGAKPSGPFRLVFAGYGGRDEDATRLFESPFSPFYPNSMTRLEDDAGRLDFANTDGTVTTLYYSDPLTVDDLKNSDTVLAALRTLTPSIIEYHSTGFAVETVSATQTRVKFLLNSIQFAPMWNLPANVPQLLVVSDVRRGSANTRGVLGTSAAVRVFTETQGVGTLYNQITSSDKAEFPLKSPCRVEPVLRKADLNAAFGDYDSLVQLDQVAQNCAIYGGSSHLNCVGPDAIVEGCVWRGNDAPLITDPPATIDAKYLQRWWFTDDFFSWGDYSVALNSNCTVSPVVATQYIVKILKPLLNKLAQYNSTTTRQDLLAEVSSFTQLYSLLQSEVDKFSRCSSNPVVEAKATQGGFVDVWQWLVTTTSYTCMLAYGLAGALLAYRMDKFKLLGFKLRDASSGFMIILGSVCMGGVYGFVIGAVPAALISQMYASIPVNLSTDWAISLGVALGILIVYFDMGRGGAEAEIAFKRGN